MATNEVFYCDVFDDERQLTLDELARLCGVQAALVIELVDEGVLEPNDMRAEIWYFTGTSVKRVQTAMHLQRDLDLNLPGIALAMDLLDELEELRRRLRRIS